MINENEVTNQLTIIEVARPHNSNAPRFKDFSIDNRPRSMRSISLIQVGQTRHVEYLNGDKGIVRFEMFGWREIERIAAFAKAEGK